jgi:hypothetical protein
MSNLTDLILQLQQNRASNSVEPVIVNINTLIGALQDLAAQSSPPSGPAGGDLSGTYPNPAVQSVHSSGVGSVIAINPATTGSITNCGLTGDTIDNSVIGGVTPAAGTFTGLLSNSFQVKNGGTVAMFGADTGATTITDATNKITRVGTPHYLNAQAPATAFVMSTTAATNVLAIGGGTGTMNAATQITFDVAANNTTAIGTNLGSITSAGWTISPANASFTLAPTGTGTITINPATAGTINNASIGVTTAQPGRFTTVEATVSLKAPVIANGAVVTALTGVGPVGSHTTVQEWFQVLNPTGTVRYIPAF